jgi:Kef-type K+ transport system membrane component KefB
MASIMAVSGIMVTVLVLSGLFHSVLRRLGQPSVISHILVRACLFMLIAG